MAKKPAKKSAKAAPKKTEAAPNIRSLTKVSGGASYAITLPREIIRTFKWKERQKLTLDVDKVKKTITIRDWKK